MGSLHPSAKIRAARAAGRRGAVDRPDPWQRGATVVGVLSVLVVGIGLILTNDFNRDQLAQQERTAREQQDLALKGQRADRFVRAVDQLGQEGTDRLGVRLGGIYALEALMKEFRADENMVIEVLCAFVRSHAPWREEDENIPTAGPDVRAAMTVLGRRPDPAAHIGLDFSNTALGLRRFNLPAADFRQADLSVSGFAHSEMPRANLQGTDFTNAFLDEANLRAANLQGAVLDGTDLKQATLTDANLRGADLTEAELTGADLVGADLSDARLYRADLRGTDLSGVVPGSLEATQLRCVEVDATTRLPAGLTPPAAGARKRPECAGDS